MFQFSDGDATVSELCKAINKTLAEQAMPVPANTFERVRVILVDALDVDSNEVLPKAFLNRDLGMD